jgi:hypothetical protein
MRSLPHELPTALTRLTGPDSECLHAGTAAVGRASPNLKNISLKKFEVERRTDVVGDTATVIHAHGPTHDDRKGK